MSDFKMEASKGYLTEEEALDYEIDMMFALSKPQHIRNFQHELDLRRSQIERLIQRHLGIPQSDFVLSPPSEWIVGGFNICLPIHISSSHYPKLPRRAIIRFPVPFSVGETFNPGNMEEKLRCEAATYVWLQRSCPTVPIPDLLGMGFPGTQSFTAIKQESLWNWIAWQLRRSLAWLYGDTLPPYFAHQRDNLTDLGYLLIEYVEEGEMLSSSWWQHRHDENRRANLYSGLAKIMLSLASVPLPRIGSWTMDNRGVISLTNRPLSDLTLIWNRQNVPTDIPRDMTYSSALPFVHDMLAYQDKRMRHQLNSILSIKDGIYQLSALAALRALVPRFWDQRSRNGPFILTLVDLHQSNIFVDDEWNVTRLIDLEFAPVRPVQMTQVPSWLSNRGVDQLEGPPHLEEYKSLYDEFVAILEKEESAGHHTTTLSQKLREDWSTGRMWYSIAMDSINAFPLLFSQHLRPKFFNNFQKDTDGAALAQLWDEKVFEFIDEKVKDQQRYVENIGQIYAEARARESEEAGAVTVEGVAETKVTEDKGVTGETILENDATVEGVVETKATEDKGVTGETILENDVTVEGVAETKVSEENSVTGETILESDLTEELGKEEDDVVEAGKSSEYEVNNEDEKVEPLLNQ